MTDSPMSTGYCLRARACSTTGYLERHCFRGPRTGLRLLDQMTTGRTRAPADSPMSTGYSRSASKQDAPTCWSSFVAIARFASQCLRPSNRRREDLPIPQDGATQAQPGANPSVIYDSGYKTPEPTKDLLSGPPAQADTVMSSVHIVSLVNAFTTNSKHTKKH